MLPCSRQQLGALGKAIWKAVTFAFDILKYTFTYPWRDSHFAIARTVTGPDTYLEQWIKVQQAEYAFIGLVGSVISAMVAQMLQSLGLAQSPWTVSAAFFISLSLSPMAVITALHNTIFLNCVSFHGSPDAKLKRIFGFQMGVSDGGNRRRNAQVWLATLMYSTPQVLLSFSIISSFVGIGLMSISPLWIRLDGIWDGPQKIACASIVGLFVALIAYFCGVLYQYTPEVAEV